MRVAGLVGGLTERPAGLRAREPYSRPEAQTEFEAAIENEATTLRAIGRSVIARQILVLLSEQTGREIVDKTGPAEAYDVEISWTRPSEPDDAFVATVLDWAIERSLGLKVTVPTFDSTS